MEREEWLKSLKAGDKVCNKTSDGKSYYVLEVKNITKGGNIRLTNGVLLKNGRAYINHGVWSGSTAYDIEPITEEVADTIRKHRERMAIVKEVRRLCSSFNSIKYDNETLIKIRDLMKIEEDE